MSTLLSLPDLPPEVRFNILKYDLETLDEYCLASKPTRTHECPRLYASLLHTRLLMSVERSRFVKTFSETNDERVKEQLAQREILRLRTLYLNEMERLKLLDEAIQNGASVGEMLRYIRLDDPPERREFNIDYRSSHSGRTFLDEVIRRALYYLRDGDDLDSLNFYDDVNLLVGRFGAKVSEDAVGNFIEALDRYLHPILIPHGSDINDLVDLDELDLGLKVLDLLLQGRPLTVNEYERADNAQLNTLRVLREALESRVGRSELVRHFVDNIRAGELSHELPVALANDVFSLLDIEGFGFLEQNDEVVESFLRWKATKSGGKIDAIHALEGFIKDTISRKESLHWIFYVFGSLQGNLLSNTDKQRLLDKAVHWAVATGDKEYEASIRKIVRELN